IGSRICAYGTRTGKYGYPNIMGITKNTTPARSLPGIQWVNPAWSAWPSPCYLDEQIKYNQGYAGSNRLLCLLPAAEKGTAIALIRWLSNALGSHSSERSGRRS